MADPADLDVLVVGAGFAGMQMLHRLRGLGFSTLVLEAGDGVGGTWYWNRYPGARCDVESMEYSYQFSDGLQQEWRWSERYAPQPEILAYADHVADRFDLRRDIRLATRVVAAAFDERSNRWVVRSHDGGEWTARFVVMATGCLSAPNTPDIPGLANFAGDTYHTGRWPHEPVDFTGRRVGVVGTGSSGIQSIPVIAEQAEQVVVFQRTAAYTVPAHNAPLDEQLVATIKADYAGFRQRNSAMPFALGSRLPMSESSVLAVSPDEAERVFEERWSYGGLGFMGSFIDLLLDRGANDRAAEFVRAKIRAIVDDPEVAERLSPRTIIGCKRLCVDTGYYRTFNRPNVELVDLKETPITEVTTGGIRVGEREIELDCIVLATGFDAMTGALLGLDIVGRDGLHLRRAWADGPRTYLGLCVSGFPNLFTITGPGSPSVLTNMMVSIDQHVNWIGACLAYLREEGFDRIEATAEAQEAWVAHVNTIADFTLFPSCDSWYTGANVEGKPRVFMPLIGFPPYVEKCDEAASNGYEGFALARRPVGETTGAR
jgi:cyclohexanone monooxygenase